MNTREKLKEYKGLLARKENFGNTLVDEFIDNIASDAITSSDNIIEIVDTQITSDLDDIKNDVISNEFEDRVITNVENIVNSDININIIKDKIKEILGVYILTKLEYNENNNITKIIDNLKNIYQNRIDSILDELEKDLGEVSVASSESYKFPLIDTRPVAESVSMMNKMGFNTGSENFMDTLGEYNSVSRIVEMIIAIPITTAILVKNVNIAPLKNSTIKFPLIASDSISDTVVNKIAKAYEVSEALQIKALLEATIARFDSGSLTARIGSLPFFNPTSKEKINNDANKKMSYDEVLGIFSESLMVSEICNSSIILAESMSYTFKNKGHELFIDDISDRVVMGENGTFIQSGRDALPTYVEMEIAYNDFKAANKLDTIQKTKKVILGVQVTPRIVSSLDIMETFKDMNDKLFNDVVQTNDERTFIKKLKNIFRFYKQKGSNEEKKILKSNTFSDMVSKIEKVRSPLFHIIISMDEYRELKEYHKVDLMDKSTYNKIMSKMPIISFTIVDLDTDIVYISESHIMNYVKRNLDDLANAMTQHEKELKAFIKTQKYM